MLDKDTMAQRSLNAKIENKKKVQDLIKNGGIRGNYLKHIPPKYQHLVWRTYQESKVNKNLIKAKCLDCASYQSAEVANCEVKSCPLWNVRPYQKGK